MSQTLKEKIYDLVNNIYDGEYVTGDAPDEEEVTEKIIDLIKQSNIALLERIEREIIGEDEGDGIAPLTYDKALRNAFRVIKRWKLDEIKKEIC